jgi:predicted RNA-binding Zn-ribbon protein involved in translation (DUF1610 family)
MQERLSCFPQIPADLASGFATPSRRRSSSSTTLESTLISAPAIKGYKHVVTSHATRLAAHKIAKHKAEFSCPHCGKHLTTKPDFQSQSSHSFLAHDSSNHFNVVDHINSLLNIVVCGTCSRGFITKWDCRRHELSQHRSAT